MGLNYTKVHHYLVHIVPTIWLSPSKQILMAKYVEQYYRYPWALWDVWKSHQHSSSIKVCNFLWWHCALQTVGQWCYGPMPSNSQNKRYIITGIDFFTCWPAAQAVARHNGNFIRRFIGQEIIKKFGTPKRILMDCSREFTSQDTQAYLCSKEIEHITTRPYYPQANGRVERFTVLC